MFAEILGMVDNYDARKVDRYEENRLAVDTCSCTDGDHTYETGISHPEYDGGDWVIVEAYDTPEDAQLGHDKWVAVMTAENLPDELVDCQNAAISKLCGELRYPRVPTEKE